MFSAAGNWARNDHAEIGQKNCRLDDQFYSRSEEHRPLYIIFRHLRQSLKYIFNDAVFRTISTFFTKFVTAEHFYERLFFGKKIRILVKIDIFNKYFDSWFKFWVLRFWFKFWLSRFRFFEWITVFVQISFFPKNIKSHTTAGNIHRKLI